MSNAFTRTISLFRSASRHSPLTTRHFVLAALLLLFSAPCALSLDPSLDISQYAHTVWTIRNGFLNGKILAMVQMPDGYLLLGTEFGLYRFDGVRATLWQLPAGQQLPGTRIHSLLLARNGTLWIGTSKGLASWKNGKLTRYPELAGGIGPMLQDRQGTVWVGTYQPGSLCAIRVQNVECFGAEKFGVGIWNLYEDHNGSLWVASATGVWRWNSTRPEHYPLPKVEISGITEDNAGELLLATNTGLKHLVGGRIQNYSLPGITGHIRPVSFFRSSDGSLWITVLPHGLLHMYRGRTDVFGSGQGLSGDDVNQIYEDREGNIWVSTESGLDRFREYTIPSVSRTQGLSSSAVWAVQATPDGSIWMGASNGLNRWANGHVTVYPTQNVPGHSTTNVGRQLQGGLAKVPRSLGLDDQGRLYVSTQDGTYDLEGNRFVRVPGAPGGNIWFVGGDGQGKLWVNDGTGGLYYFTPGQAAQPIPWSRFGEKDSGPHGVLPDHSDGGVWLGFDDGWIGYFKGGEVRASYRASDGLGNGRANSLRFGSQGALWVATEGGLSRVRDKRVQTLTSKNGLPCDTVHWSMEDDVHFVWLYQPCGLVRIASSELDAWANDPNRRVQAAVFDASDGVRAVSTFGGYGPHVTRALDGKIWFVVYDGVSVLDPRHLPHNDLPPPVHIEQVTADGKVYDAANGVRLPRLVRYVDIDYTALSLAVPEKVRFRVKLEGEDKDWRELVNVRRVSYTNLGPKHYRFLVKACNNSGVWNEEGAALDFVIPPAWYQTNWFLALCVAAFLALFWAIYQYRLHQMARQFQMTLDTRVAERTRIARDLHDTLLQSFHGVLLFLQSGIHLMAEHPSEGMRTLETAVDQAERAIIEGREAVQGLRASTVERNDLALAIKTFGAELASADSNSPRPEFSVQVEGVPRNLHPILRDEVFRIAGEAMRNTFCHADAKQIEVEIRYDERQLRLRVRDDGKGIDPKVLSDQGREGHYGLRGMRERAKLIGGKLTVWSELDAGTEVELSIPASRAYTAADGQRSWLAEKFAKFSGKDTELKS